MKIVVYAHRLEVGGTQVNAIELAAGLRDRHGFDVVLFATPGPMLQVALDKRLRFVAAPDAYLHPSPSRMAALRALVREERPDLIHVWDWWQCVDAYYAVHLPMQVPLVVTDMMMEPTRILPKQLWTTFGTPELVDRARAAGRRKVDLLLPPVDVRLERARRRGCAAASAAAYPPARRDPARDGVATAGVDEVGGPDPNGRRGARARPRLPLKFAIVGDGTARAKLERLAAEANDELGREAVVLTGALLDPRPAYAAADIVVGMGGSALRGMAFGKCVIVIGENGFSAPFEPDTAESFYYRGMYGRGDDDPANARLTRQLSRLASDSALRAEIGRFSRGFASERFSIEAGCARLAELCSRAASDKAPRWAATFDALRTSAVYIRERRFLSASRERLPVDTVRNPIG